MSRWIILRTSGGQTVQLAEALRAAGYDAWTPARTIRKTIGAGTRKGARQIEVTIPILATFVFARAEQLVALATLAKRPFKPQPDFSVFTYAGKAPEIADRDVRGLQEEEARAAAAMQAIRDAETHAEAERLRIAEIRRAGLRRQAERAAERQRRAALRSQACTLAPGTEVHIADMPALVGVTGVVEATDGSYAEVRFGTQSWKIEGWRVLPADLDQLAA